MGMYSLGRNNGEDIMGNPQERLVTKQFIAGLITGEGWFSVTRQKSSDHALRYGFTLRPRFCLSMTDRETMRLVLRTWEHLGLPVRTVDTAGGLRLEIGGMDRVAAILRVFRPLLTGNKRRAADLVQAYIDLRNAKGRAPAHYDEREFSIVGQIRAVNAGNGHLKHWWRESSETLRRAALATRAEAEDKVQASAKVEE
jgi:hypothetical protein